MRIALYHNLPPGGAYRYMYEVVRRSSTVHSYELFTPAGPTAEEGGRMPTELPIDRYCEAVHRVGGGMGRGTGPLRPFALARAERAAEVEAARQINSGGFDLAFVHSSKISQAPGVLQHLRVPSLYMLQEVRRRSFEPGYLPDGGGRTGIRLAAWRAGQWFYERGMRRRDRLAVASATTVMVISRFSGEMVERFYHRPAVLGAPGVDVEVFAPGPPVASTPYLVSVGALDPVKGHDLAIEAIGLLSPSGRPRLDIVFEREYPGYRVELESLAARLEVEARFHQGLSDPELAAIYSGAVGTIAAARLEPFGLTVLESLSCGTPVVAVAEGGLLETVDEGVNGYLVARNPEAFAAGLARLLSSGVTGTSASIRERATARWSWEAAVTGIHEQFGTLAGNSGYLAEAASSAPGP